MENLRTRLRIRRFAVLRAPYPLVELVKPELAHVWFDAVSAGVDRRGRHAWRCPRSFGKRAIFKRPICSRCDRLLKHFAVNIVIPRQRVEIFLINIQ